MEYSINLVNVEKEAANGPHRAYMVYRFAISNGSANAFGDVLLPEGGVDVIEQKGKDPRTAAKIALERLLTAPPISTGGFNASRAYEHVRHLVEIGPRPPGSDGIRAAQSYIIGQLKSFGCQVEEHDFHSSTPVGDFTMKNITAKTSGTGSGIVLYYALRHAAYG